MLPRQYVPALAVLLSAASCGGHADNVGTFANSCSDGTLMGAGSFACVDFGDGYTAGSCNGSGFTLEVMSSTAVWPPGTGPQAPTPHAGKRGRPQSRPPAATEN